MKAYLYILLSADNHYYVGSTNNLKRRFQEHENGKTPSLRYKRPLKLLFYQEYGTLKQARQIENKLKRHRNRKIIEQIVKEGTIKLRE